MGEPDAIEIDMLIEDRIEEWFCAMPGDTPAPEQLLGEAQRELRRLRAFERERNVFLVADPLRGVAGTKLDAPEMPVERVVDLVGPRGGTIWLQQLSCGHSIWNRSRKPKTKARCIACGITALATRNIS